MYDVKGKTAIVTGGGTGIGRAVTLMLAERGANVVVNYSRSESDAIATLSEAKKLGADGMICKADVSKDADARRMFAEAMAKFGRVDVVVNNAGTTDHVAMEDLEGLKEEYWDNAWNTNVKGHFFLIRACAEELKKNKGCVVNVCSISGITGRGSSMAYCASKAAAISVTKSFALVLAPDVRVNAVLPGVVMTRWVGDKPEFARKLSAGTPLGRPAEAEDVGEAVVSLITGASFITGQAVIVDGGYTIINGNNIR